MHKRKFFQNEQSQKVLSPNNKLLANKNINFVQKNIKIIGKQIEKTKGMVSQKSIREKLNE